MNVLAVDPGKTTGIATWYGERHLAFAVPREVAERTVHQWLMDCPKGEDNLLVFESFTITAQTLKKSRDGQEAIEFIGVGRYLARLASVAFETQSPSDAFSFSTREKLKALGWKTPGPGDHSRSASQHLLLALVRHQAIDLAALARGVGVGFDGATS